MACSSDSFSVIAAMSSTEGNRSLLVKFRSVEPVGLAVEIVPGELFILHVF